MYDSWLFCSFLDGFVSESIKTRNKEWERSMWAGRWTFNIPISTTLFFRFWTALGMCPRGDDFPKFCKTKPNAAIGKKNCDPGRYEKQSLVFDIATHSKLVYLWDKLSVW